MNSTKSHFSNHHCLLGRIIVMTLFVFASFVGQVHAQDFEGKNITEVSIQYRGAKTVDEPRLRNMMSTKAGTQYRAERLDNDITALYEAGLVDDVRILAKPVGADVNLIAEVTTRPAISGEGFVGNTIFSDQKLAKETKLKFGGPLSDARILEARRNIERFYQDSAYPDVLVSHRIGSAGQSDQIMLVFVIDEGAKIEIREIRFEGNAALPTSELKKKIKSKESGHMDFELLDRDRVLVLDYYRSKGYLEASSPGVRREHIGNGKFDLIFPIHEGAKYIVAGVAFGQTSVFKPEELHSSMTLKIGDTCSSKKIQDDIDTIRRLYRERGYTEAVVIASFNDAGPNRLNVEYQITEGSVLSE